MPKKAAKKPARTAKKVSPRKKATPAKKPPPKREVKAEIIRAPKVDIIPANPGDQMAPSLELNGLIIREELDRLREKQLDEGLKPSELGHLNQLTQSNTRVERSLRQWRELKKREAGELSEEDLAELIPRALVALGVSESTVRQVLEEMAASS